jgi:hypothetical protein
LPSESELSEEEDVGGSVEVIEEDSRRRPRESAQIISINNQHHSKTKGAKKPCHYRNQSSGGEAPLTTEVASALFQQFLSSTMQAKSQQEPK